jgi:hypothetical protein
MFQLDDKFLQDLGLDSLPSEQKQAFLEHIYNQLELRVGTRLSDGLSDAQLSEFEAFVDRDDERVRAWVGAYVPAYATDPSYMQLHDKAPAGADTAAILAEYASLKWLSINRPDYKQVVAQVLDELKREIMDSRDTILAG